MDGDYTGAEHTYIVETLKNLHDTAPWRYVLPRTTVNRLHSMEDPFDKDDYRHAVFLKTYSRRTFSQIKRQEKGGIVIPSEEVHKYLPPTKLGRKERWVDVVIRVIEGLFSFYVSASIKRREDELHSALRSWLPREFPNSSKNVENMVQACLEPLASNVEAILESSSLPLEELNQEASKMAFAMFEMKWLPPGRGIYAMGTDHTYANGAASLNNCYYVSTDQNVIKAAVWGMDMSMNGGGVGFDVSGKFEVCKPNKEDSFTFVIPDTRQGWCAAYELLLRAYIPVEGQITNKFPLFDFSLIRPHGEPIRGFGGTASGPEPLYKHLAFTEICLDTFLKAQGEISQKELYVEMFKRMHEANCYLPSNKYDYASIVKEIEDACERADLPFDSVQLIANLFNSWAKCVVSGNVRRSAQIMCGDPEHTTLMQLKDYSLYPWRRHIMHLSNNSYRLWKDDDFTEMIPRISKFIRTNGEPGIINMINVLKYARYGDTSYGQDNAEGINPCGETPLSKFEACCLAIILPYLCKNEDGSLNEEEIFRISRYATFYASVVSMIPHHWKETNEITSQNHRIGVSFAGATDVYSSYGYTSFVSLLRNCYTEIREHNRELMQRFGFPPSIRVTVEKPDGNTSAITGLAPGAHFTICQYAKRRIALDKKDPLVPLLSEAGYEIEESTFSENDVYAIFPICNPNNDNRSAEDVSMFEKFCIATSLQKHYADNSVSVTIDFTPDEGALIEDAIAMNIAQLKSVSLMPQFRIMADNKGKAIYYTRKMIERFLEQKEQTKDVLQILDTISQERNNLPSLDEICNTPEFEKSGLIPQYKHIPNESISETTYYTLKQKTEIVDWSVIYRASLNTKDLSRDRVAYCTTDSCELRSSSSSLESSFESNIDIGEEIVDIIEV